MNVAANLNAVLTLTADCTVTISGFVAGAVQFAQLRTIQDTSPRTIVIAGALTPGSAGLTLSTGSGAEDIISIFWNGTNQYAEVVGLDFG